MECHLAHIVVLATLMIPPTQAEGSSECCSTLIIVSTGVASESKPDWLGTYAYHTNHNNYNAYKRIGQEQFIHRNPYDHWAVSEEIGIRTGHIYHQTCIESCPEDCDYNWLAGTHDGWKADETLRVTCDSSRCCSKLQLVSSGNARRIHSDCLGTYEYYTHHNSYNAYKHIGEELFLYWNPYSWRVNYEIGSTYGLIQHKTCGEVCPENCDNHWSVSEPGWKVDDTLMVTCDNRTIPCPDMALNNVASRPAMEENGWEFHVSQWDKREFDDICGNDTWYGFYWGNGKGSVSANFKGSGFGILTFGNCWTHNEVEVYLNHFKISYARGNVMRKEIQFHFYPGDKLLVTEVGAIIKLHSLSITCSSADVHLCTADQFKCILTAECIPSSWLCDAEIDCEDTSDEADCIGLPAVALNNIDTTTTTGECCNQVIIQSDGPASVDWFWDMGDYEKVGNESNVYKNIMDSGGFLFMDSDRHWMVGSPTTREVGIKHTKCTAACPNFCSQKWSVVDQKMAVWKLDSKLKVSCGMSKCCKNLKISSHGMANIKQWSSMGDYHYYGTDPHGARIYYNFQHSVFLIRGHLLKNWRVDTEINGLRARLMHPMCHGQYCPENCLKQEWQYADDEWQWPTDSTLRVDCANTNVSISTLTSTIMLDTTATPMDITNTKELDPCAQNNASCYGAPTINPTDRCCHTCKDIRTAYQNMGWNLALHNVIQCSDDVQQYNIFRQDEDDISYTGREDLSLPVVIAGGQVTGGSLLDDVDVVDNNTNCKVDPIPIKLYGAAGINGMICGGEDYHLNIHSSCWHLNASGAWTVGEDMLIRRKFFTMTKVADRVIAIGGQTTSGIVLNTAEKYSLIKDEKWSYMKDAPTSIRKHCTVPINTTYVMVIGGIQNQQPYSKNTWFYYLKHDDWTPGPDMIKGRELHACAMRGKDVYVIGGEVSTRNSLEVWHGNTWSYSIGPIGATSIQLISQGRYLYLFGGWEDNKLNSKIWKIDQNNEFTEVGSISIARRYYSLFTVPHSFLKNCKGIICGNYGKANSCANCPIIYPKDSCSGECGWVLNSNTQEYDCVDRVCPGYGYQFIPSEYSLKQDMRLYMDLYVYRGVWDTHLNRVIAPLYQKIIFDSETTNPFSFNVILHHSANTKQYFNTSWSKKIDTATYKEDENYGVVIKFYYHGQNSATVEKCIGESINIKYKKFNTRYWGCFNSTSSNPELVNIKKLCDGISDCSDSSDEAATLCKPKYSFFELIVMGVVTIFVSLGIFTFILIQMVSSIVNNNEDGHVANIGYVTTEIIHICVESGEEHYRKNKGLDPIDIQKIRRIYTPCQNNEEKKRIFKILFTLSLNDQMKNFVWQILDEIFKMEEEVHNTKGEVIDCMRFCKYEDSYLSAFIKEAIERYDLFTKLGRRIINLLTVDVALFALSSLYANFFVGGVMALFHLVLFYYDLVKDIIVVYILSYLENAILTDEDSKTKFDTVGGMNFQVIIVYLALVLVISEAAIYFQVHSREHMFEKTFNIGPHSRVCKILVNVFPMHFIFLQKCVVNTKLLLLKKKMQTMFNKNIIYQIQWIVKDVITITNEIQELENQLYNLNRLGNEILVIETAVEKEPQSVVQLCLFILMKHFKRIKLLFSSYFDISIETIFALSWLMTILSITKSVYGYLHAKRWPIVPGLLGSIVQHLAIAFLVLSKLHLISTTLLNAVYLHPFLYMMNLFLIFSYNKLLFGSTGDYFQHILVIGISPAFYNPSKIASNSDIVRFCSKILQKYGIVINAAILHLITLITYCTMGAILRNTMFHYNIKTTYGITNDTIKDNTNGTMRLSGDERNQEMQRYVDKIMFEKPLHSFPVEFVVVYIICILIYILLSVIYYRAFHPWKIIISEKKASAHLQEAQLECVPQQDIQEVQLECAPQQDIQEVQLECAPQQDIQEVQLECIPQQHIHEVQLERIPQQHMQKSQLECFPKDVVQLGGIPQKHDNVTLPYTEISHL